MSYSGLPPTTQVLMWAYDRVSGNDAERMEKAEKIGAWLLSWKSPQPDRVLGAPLLHVPSAPKSEPNLKSSTIHKAPEHPMPLLPVINSPQQPGQIVDPHLVLPQAIPGVRSGVAVHELPSSPLPAIDSAELERAMAAYKVLGDQRNASTSPSPHHSIAEFFGGLKRDTQAKLTDVETKFATGAVLPQQTGAAVGGGDAASPLAMPRTLDIAGWEAPAKSNNHGSQPVI